jgi:hypothetical protein
MDEKLFKSGETIEQFLDKTGDKKVEFLSILKECEATESASKFEDYPPNLRVVAIAEYWLPEDVLYNLPILLDIAKRATNWEVRIFLRDGEQELISNYLKDGIYHAIPVIIFYDENFNELGHWVERPKSASQVFHEETLKLHTKLWKENKDEWRKETRLELSMLLDSADLGGQKG